MIIFSIVCALLVGLALVFVLPPLRHPDRVAAVSSLTDANAAVYRRQLAEMEAERRQRMITDDQFLRDREELEQRLIADVSEASKLTPQHRSVPGASGLIYVLAVGLPLAALLLYLVLGAPSAIGTPP